MGGDIALKSLGYISEYEKAADGRGTGGKAMSARAADIGVAAHRPGIELNR